MAVLRLCRHSGFSLVAASRAHSRFVFQGLLWRHSRGFSGLAPGSSCSVQVGSSWTRNRTRVSCIGRRIFYLCATGEVLSVRFPVDPLGFKFSLLGAARQGRSPMMTKHRMKSLWNQRGLCLNSSLTSCVVLVNYLVCLWIIF